MLHEVYIETETLNNSAVYSYKNESIAMQVFEAAIKWGIQGL